MGTQGYNLIVANMINYDPPNTSNETKMHPVATNTCSTFSLSEIPISISLSQEMNGAKTATPTPINKAM